MVADSGERERQLGRTVELIPLDRVALGSVVWTLRLPDQRPVPHVTVVVAASWAFDGDNALLRGDAEMLQSERQDDARGCSDLAPYLCHAEVRMKGVIAGARPRLTVGREQLLVDKRGESAASFAPLAPSASARRALGAGVEEVGGQLEVPVDCDWRYFQVVPEDQRCDFLLGDEWVEASGLATVPAEVRLKLPQASGEARVFGLADGQHGRALPMRLDGLLIDGQARRLTLRWRGGFPVREAGALTRLRVVVGVARAGEPIDWTAVSAVMAQPTPSMRADVAETRPGFAGPDSARLGAATLVSEQAADDPRPGRAAARPPAVEVTELGDSDDEVPAGASEGSIGEGSGMRALAVSDAEADALRERLGIPVKPRGERRAPLGSEVLVASSADAEELRRLMGIGQLPGGGCGAISLERDDSAEARSPGVGAATAPLGPLPVRGAPWSQVAAAAVRPGATVNEGEDEGGGG